MLQKSKQQLESKSQKQDDEIIRKDLITTNLQRMLFGSKKERFIAEDKAQLLFSFEEFASTEDLNDQTPVKEKISYESEKPKKHAGRNKLPEYRRHAEKRNASWISMGVSCRFVQNVRI
jgi:hypothetical protein